MTVMPFELFFSAITLNSGYYFSCFLEFQLSFMNYPIYAILLLLLPAPSPGFDNGLTIQYILIIFHLSLNALGPLTLLQQFPCLVSKTYWNFCCYFVSYEKAPTRYVVTSQWVCVFEFLSLWE